MLENNSSKKTALITGTAGSLCSFLAKTLHNQGYNTILHYHTNEKLTQELAKELNSKMIIQADLTNYKEVQNMFDKIGAVDLLINGIGNFIYSPLLTTKATDFDACIHNNLMSAWYCIKEALPNMRKNNFGRIINFGCVSCDQLTSRENTTPYYIAKTALLMLTRSFGQELRNTNVRINMISPGVLPTGHSAQNPDIPNVPFDAIAQAMLFLIRDESKYIQGANLEVSAGWRPS